METGGQAHTGPPQLAAPGLWRARPAGSGGASSWLLDGNSWLLCYGFLYLALYAQVSQSKPCERTGSCFSGRCVNSTCLCDPGWVGDQCQHCQGRFKLARGLPPPRPRIPGLVANSSARRERAGVGPEPRPLQPGGAPVAFGPARSPDRRGAKPLLSVPDVRSDF
ncbi:Attractin-like protein 1 [Saguinus oedipus]|uniref:Attractin-like protein 1 n=1 Tax=Saguinus oedipus TaxID=9490 RepID=A0ABQ9UPP0_SAGOE|nr:Attractin-like protein 1 [Saguinus oedipus]